MKTDAPKLVLVPMTYSEAVELLAETVSEMPHPLPYNVEHKQWDLMLPNIESLERKLWRAKRILAAVSEAPTTPKDEQTNNRRMR